MRIARFLLKLAVLLFGGFVLLRLAGYGDENLAQVGGLFRFAPAALQRLANTLLLFVIALAAMKIAGGCEAKEATPPVASEKE